MDFPYILKVELTGFPSRLLDVGQEKNLVTPRFQPEHMQE